MCTMANSLKSLKHLGYRFSGSQRTIHLMQYADDTCLISDGPASCKKLLRGIERWLDWSGMKAKVPKCHSLALQASTAKKYDPKLHLYGQPIHFIGNHAIKFLGMKVQVPFDFQTCKDSLAAKLSTMLEKVDAVPISSHQKRLLYRAAVCPRLNWDFMVNQLPISWVTSILEATATRFLKKWVGLARPATPSSLYLPKKNGGLGLPAISTVYKKQQASTASLILTSHDPVVQHAATLAIRREEDLCRPTHRPMLEVRDIWQTDPGANRKSLLKRAKAQVTECDSERRLEHARGLQHQGQLLRATDDKTANIWSSAVLQLPPEVLSFSMNAAQDTLPHNANLSRWRRNNGLSDACKLCGMRQTLPHVLNQCPISLQLRRYNTRHDAVLEVIVNGIKPLLSDGECLIADLPNHKPYTFPPYIAHTDLRPDLVLWNTTNHMVCLVELTICYETRYEEAHTLKQNKYADLVEEIKGGGIYSPELIMLEVGSRGPFNPAGFNELQAYLNAPKKEWETMLVSVTRTVIIESHKIWTMRNWRSPEFPETQ